MEKLEEHWDKERRKVIEDIQEEWDSTDKESLQHLNLAEGTADRKRFDKFFDSFRYVMIKYWK